jgi:hypothetical protein
MDLAVASAAFVIAALAAGVMGFAIQRGATCTVAAVDEALTRRTTRRLAALVEASLWVAGGLLLAAQFHWLEQPPGYALTGWTLAGAVLLGLGAFVNRACVFGAIARLGSGEWAYVATPIGFFAGCLSVDVLFAPPMMQPVNDTSPVFATAYAGWMIAAVLLWRVIAPAWSSGSARPLATLAPSSWSPRAATVVIGLTFLVTLVAANAWAYTDVLADLARGMADSIAARTALAAALLAGACIGGWTAGLFRARRVSVGQLAGCFAGGLLMGWGSLLIPGGNDGLILVGMPLLWPYAWAAFATMCITIATAQIVQGRVRQLWLAKSPATDS